MSIKTTAGRLGPREVAWLLAVLAAWFGHVVGTDDRARPVTQAAGRE